MIPRFLAIRAAMVLTVATPLLLPAATPARAQASPTVERLHRMLKTQQQSLIRQRRLIMRLAERIRLLRRDLEAARREKRRGREPATAAPTTRASPARPGAGRWRAAAKRPGYQWAAARPSAVEPGRTKRRRESTARIFGGLLYVKPVSNQYQIAFEDPSSNAIGAPGPGSVLRRIDPDFSFGFRVGLGLSVPYTNIDARVAFSYAASNAESSFRAPAGGAVRPLVFSSSTSAASAATSGRAGYDLTVFAVDAEIGHRITVGSTGTVRLFGGVRFLGIDHDIRARFLGGSLGTAQATFRNRSNYLGGGPRLGARAHVDLPWGFFLSGTAAGSFLFGRMTIDHDEIVPGVTQVGFTFNNTMPFILGVAAELGVGWLGDLTDSSRLKVVLGYQFWHWTNASAMASFADAANAASAVIRREDLSMHGPFLRATLTFRELGDLLVDPFGLFR